MTQSREDKRAHYLKMVERHQLALRMLDLSFDELVGVLREGTED